MNRLIDYKRTYIASDGEEYINLSAPSYEVNRLKAMSVYKLNQDHNGRIDTFTFNNVLQNVDDIDLVMYINHIYNPFAVKEGDVLYAPKSDDFYFNSEEPTLVDGTHYSDRNTTTKKRTYAETVEYLAKLGYGLK